MINKQLKYWAGRAVFIFVGIVILNSCRDDHNVGNPTELSLFEIKWRLATARDAGNLVTKIEQAGDGYSVHIEEVEPMWVRSDLIKSITYDSSQWMATFNFADDTSKPVNFVGELSIGNTNLQVDPHLTSPLSALASFATPVSGKFRVVVHGKSDEGIAIGHSFDSFTDQHELPILGLYENHINKVELVFMNHNGRIRCSKIIEVPVAAFPHPVLDVQVLHNQLSNAYNGLYLISDNRIAVDSRGEVRWYYKGPGRQFFDKLKNGNFLTSSLNNRTFYEVTMLGESMKAYSVPNALHHEIVEMPSGNFLVASHSPPGPPREDVVVEVSRSTGEVIRSWDFNLLLDPTRKTLPDASPADWLHINAMYFDEADNSFVVSGRSQCAVIKVDYATGQVKWILGNHNFWNESLSQFLLKPVDAHGNEINTVTTDFWQYGQHAVHVLSNGNLLLYDNGAYRGYYDDPSVSDDSYTRVVEYKINEVQRTVELVWQFTNNKSVFTKITGYTQPLPSTESRLVSYMWVSQNTPRILELDANNNVIYEATINEGKSAYYRTLKVYLYEGMTLYK